jgi:glycerol-3-phosphate O-acyltransferase
MSTAITLPLWLVLLVVVLALIGLTDRILTPSLRWLLRRRVDRVIADLNQKLTLELQQFKLTKRSVLIDRLCFDPHVVAAIEAESAATGTPRQVLAARVERDAREIVPSFNAYLYFRLGYALARRVAQLLYRVRVGFADEEALGRVDPRSTVVFVMNHRSNMDYVLVAYLTLERTALSYAVGEWARVWPLEQLIRAMGAYFVRRNSNSPLYRRVLERYVAMATAEGVTQAVFPEGGLSRDGALRPPKLGLIDYLAKGFDPQGSRDIVFIPVGMNYDRVLEDRSLLLGLDRERPRRGPAAALATTLKFAARNFWQMARGRWYRFGYACVNFGTPVSLRQWCQARSLDFRALEKEPRFRAVETLTLHLMQEIGAVVPVLPVSLVASVVLAVPQKRFTVLALKAAALRLMERFEAAGAHLYLPRHDRDYAFETGLRMLTLRRLVMRDANGLLGAAPGELAVLRYYANAIAHLLQQPVAERAYAG